MYCLIFLIVYLITPMTSLQITHKLYFDVNVDGKSIGQLNVGLYGIDVPQAVEKFYQLTISDDPNVNFESNAHFNFLEPNEYIRCTYKGTLSNGGIDPEEKLQSSFDRRGLLAMVNEISNDWFITLAPLPHLDGHYIVFGEIIQGMEVFQNMLNEITIDDHNTIEQDVSLDNCGELEIVPLNQRQMRNLQDTLQMEAEKPARTLHDEL
ncbi:hypothetical protein KAFR_0E01290 [Kazachstania africana CBS 2517]|uniref:Peptidyl-prolyl cis-trans isomerase n=1 Tax=Kazachstania africana (strain ATCC 22294 / BCRC 22015 / CBS 2517 / CECT 1963 / NBRC 1671 / NRRL Y-8276) TaxID=1071382 RepID=H2AV83_KAZAF|nr:hypothetical protein KAFR_0E01290 [Kazachstania africana CBS 2517]CCF58283.1 hypothetical protein KAFR_0E01290 [Kazachstania africana CBS 2517]